jgi:hypothetical protein
MNSAKWVGMWILNSLIATLGVAITVGLLTHATRSFTTRATRIHSVLTPYYPVDIAVGFVVGFFTYTGFKGSYRYRAWLGPATLVLVSLLAWKSTNQVSWWDATVHFFGPLPYPENHDQLDTSVLLYTAIAYSLGAFIQTRLQDWKRDHKAALSKESE